MAHLPLMIEPLQLRAPWPPNDAMDKIAVTSADNWTTLQARFGRANAWDIIIYNFNTRDPVEVNWYLHNRIGCTLVTRDHENFRFGFGDPKHPAHEIPAPAGKKLEIFIPHPKWRPASTADEILRREVIRTLRTAGTMNAQVGFLSISGQEFGDVVEMIEANRISVRHNSKMSDPGAYTPTSQKDLPPNMMEFRFAFPTGPNERALIVHEAVHAALDIRGESTNKEEDEGLAHVVQSLWILKMLGSWAGPLKEGNVVGDKLLEIAWEIALSIDDIGVADEVDVTMLHETVSLHERYRLMPFDRDYDGV